MNLQSYATRRTEVESLRSAKMMRQVVSIRNPEGISPLFCIHPSGGDIGIYRKLATKLDSSRSIFGIQSRLECGEETELSSLEEMAHQYAQIIETKKPEGAIRLLGFSLGGFLASLIARNLQESGREVSFLGMIDSNPGWTIESEASRNQLCVRVAQMFAKFQNIGVMRKKPAETVQRDVAILVDTALGDLPISSTQIMAKTTAMGYVPDRQVDVYALNKFTSTFLTHCRLLKNFHPPKVECPLSLWWPSETENENIKGTAIWSQRAQSTITNSEIEGSHFSIMRGPSVRVLAAEVESAIELSESLVNTLK